VSPAGRGAGGGERSGCDRFRVVIVAAHPDPASFNAALVTAAAEAARRLGGDVRVHDLYRDGFDPRLAVSELPSQPAAAGMPGTESVAAKHVRFADDLTSRYAHDLVGADVVIVVHPVWFFHVPAILKGWVDRVVREDVAFELGPDGRVAGLLRARSVLIVTTANTSSATETAVFGAPVETFWRTVVFGPAGVKSVERLALAPVRNSDDATRAAWLAQVAAATSRHVRDVRRMS